MECRGDGRTNGRTDGRRRSKKEPGNQNRPMRLMTSTPNFVLQPRILARCRLLAFVLSRLESRGIIIAVQLGAIALDSSTALLHGVNNL